MKQVIWILVLLTSLLTACGKQDEVRDAPVDRISKINLELGIAYMHEERYAEAMRNLQKAIDHNPDDPNIYSALALLYDRIGEPEKAESAFEKTIGMNGKDSLTRNNFGAFLCAQGRYEDAYEQYRAALGNPLYKTPEYAHTNAGLCALRSKDYKKAETEFRAALRKNPKFAIALFQMAKISYGKGRLLQTRAYIQRFDEVAEPGPESLWLSIRVEKKLGDHNSVASQSLLLKARYPDSEETRQLLEME